MITAQIFNANGLTTMQGDPVVIHGSPPGSQFLICNAEIAEFWVFSVDTGCWVSSGDTHTAAKMNAEILFRKYRKYPNYLEWWRCSCDIFKSYLAWMWLSYYHVSLSPCPAATRRRFSILPDPTQDV